MLKKNTRYVLRTEEHEKTISINNDLDARYWNDKKAEHPEWTFTEVTEQRQQNVCIACEG